MDFDGWRNTLLRLQGRRDALIAQSEDNREKLSQVQEEKVVIEEARAIVQQVAAQTQSQLQVQLSTLCSIAMAAVFPDPYELSVEFVERRGKTECDIMFERDGALVSPLTSSGGGAIDIASLALRLSLWSMAPKRSRPLFILDEPLKWLKGDDLPVKGAELLSYFAHELGVQIVMVSHSDELIESADNVIRVSNINNQSHVQVAV